VFKSQVFKSQVFKSQVFKSQVFKSQVCSSLLHNCRDTVATIPFPNERLRLFLILVLLL
jgi:hypothetical protein